MDHLQQQMPYVLLNLQAPSEHAHNKLSVFSFLIDPLPLVQYACTLLTFYEYLNTTHANFACNEMANYGLVKGF